MPQHGITTDRLLDATSGTVREGFERNRLISTVAPAPCCLGRSVYSKYVRRQIRPSRFELPRAARIVLWAVGIFFTLWALLVIVTVTFMPHLYR
jgi:hypothetical protein